jgi:LPXTG-motif cell wall-anchored protein
MPDGDVPLSGEIKELPDTGGISSGAYTLGGMAMILTGWLLGKKKRYWKRPNQQ